MESFLTNQTSSCTDLDNHNVQIFGFQIFLLVLLETLGNVLLLAMIIYEKYGMDPQKRTLSNQLFSLLCGSFIFMNLVGIPLMLLMKEEALNPTTRYQVKIAAVLVFNGVLFFCFLTITEILISSLLQLTHFSRMAGIDEYFVTTWLLSVNVLFSVLQILTRYLSGEVFESSWVCPDITGSKFHTQIITW